MRAALRRHLSSPVVRAVAFKQQARDRECADAKSLQTLVAGPACSHCELTALWQQGHQASGAVWYHPVQLHLLMCVSPIGPAVRLRATMRVLQTTSRCQGRTAYQQKRGRKRWQRATSAARGACWTSALPTGGSTSSLRSTLASWCAQPVCSDARRQQARCAAARSGGAVCTMCCCSLEAACCCTPSQQAALCAHCIAQHMLHREPHIESHTQSAAPSATQSAPRRHACRTICCRASTSS